MPDSSELPLPDQLLADVQQAVGKHNVLSETGDTWVYGSDNSRRHHAPDLVVFAEQHEQVVAIVQACDQARVPLTVRGRGTGTTGAVVPINGGVVLSLERMCPQPTIDAANRVAHVAPGVLNQDLQQAAAAHGLFWPPDPSSAAFCTIGGNLGFNSAGPRAVKYGTPRDNILGLRAVTGDGQSLRTGVYTSKGVVGYDLTRLLVGSEGTLAIITEALLKLTPLPESRISFQALFTQVEAATAAIVQLMAQPLTPCALEFMDHACLQLIREQGHENLPATAKAMLLIEVDGPQVAMDRAREAVLQATDSPALLHLEAAQTAAEAENIWTARKALSPALRTIAPNKLNEDIVVPVTRIPELIHGLQKISDQFGIPIVNFGHAGNGNLHCNLLYDTQDAQQASNAYPCLEALFQLVLQLDGTLSGEHGTGLEKRDFVGWEIEPATLELMRRIKLQFDPHGILNPGKMFPVDAYSRTGS